MFLPIDEAEKIFVQISLKDWRKDHKYKDLRSVLNFVLGLIKDEGEKAHYKKEKEWSLSRKELEITDQFKKLSLQLERRLYIYDKYSLTEDIELLVPDIERIIARCLRGTPIYRQIDQAKLFNFEPDTSAGIRW